MYDADKSWLGPLPGPEARGSGEASGQPCAGGVTYYNELRPDLYERSCTCPWPDKTRHALQCPALTVVGTPTVNPKLPRPDWDTIWIDFASALALRSTCSRASVGCVVVSTDNSTVLGLGYNGGARGVSNACLSDEPGKCGHIHAEINALLKANYRDAATRKAYLTLSPCFACATALINFGVEEVIYRDEYRDLTGVKLLGEAGVKVRQFDPKRIPERDLYINKDGP
jgi:dCMP deaminase